MKSVPPRGSGGAKLVVIIGLGFAPTHVIQARLKKSSQENKKLIACFTENKGHNLVANAF